MFKPEELAGVRTTSVEDALVAARGALRLVADLTCEECFLSKEAQQALCAMTSEAAALIDGSTRNCPR